MGKPAAYHSSSASRRNIDSNLVKILRDHESRTFAHDISFVCMLQVSLILDFDRPVHNEEGGVSNSEIHRERPTSPDLGIY